MAGQIDHPILITECACNPVQSRSKMAELLFETYGVPAVGMNLSSFFWFLDMIVFLNQMFDSNYGTFCVLLLLRFLDSQFVTAFGVDAAFSYKYNQLHGICKKDGIVLCPGFTTTHAIPV